MDDKVSKEKIMEYLKQVEPDKSDEQLANIANDIEESVIRVIQDARKQIDN